MGITFALFFQIHILLLFAHALELGATGGLKTADSKAGDYNSPKAKPIYDAPV